MRQGFKPLADYRANRGFWPLARDQETGFFPISSPVTKYSRKNPVSGHPSNHGKIKIGVTDNSPQWKKPAPRPIGN